MTKFKKKAVSWFILSVVIAIFTFGAHVSNDVHAGQFLLAIGFIIIALKLVNMWLKKLGL
mgnify:CR=1|jgi:hypothetical protein